MTFFFFLRVINDHVDLCTAAAAHFYFKSTAVQHGSPGTPFSTDLLNIIYYSLWIWVEERERDSMAET